VRVLHRAGAQLLRRQLLNHPPALHDEQPLAEMRHHREVMADEDIGEPVLGAERFEEVQNLLLQLGIERVVLLVL
jgi:hypothetical protein